MDSKKKIFGLFVLLALVIALAAAINRANRPQIDASTIAVECGGKTTVLELEKLPYEFVEGTLVNGKQQKVEVSGQGARLVAVLAMADLDSAEVQTVVVTADDSYTAQITGEELLDNEGIYLLREENEVRLVVFGDLNRKRNVSDVKQLSVELK